MRSAQSITGRNAAASTMRCRRPEIQPSRMGRRGLGAQDRGVQFNKFHDRGYPRCCEPCTAQSGRRGYPPGRWWWERSDAKEGGLHVRNGNRVKERDREGAEKKEESSLRNLDHLDWLESEAIHILREVAAECRNPALLFSGGKDSICLLRLAEKAFRPGKFPFPLLHIDTGHNFPEVIAFRDARAAELGERLVVGHVEESMRKGRVRLRSEDESRNKHQSVTLLDTIAEHGFDACIGGARRDEEKSRAKERIFSFRDEFGQWDPKNQRPELWSLFNTRVNPGENIRVFPISNWTELDVWQYIRREELAVPSIYYAHRVSIRRLAVCAVVGTGQTQTRRDVETFRCVSARRRNECTCPVESPPQRRDIIAERGHPDNRTRATRMDDQTSERRWNWQEGRLFQNRMSAIENL